MPEGFANYLSSVMKSDLVPGSGSIKKKKKQKHNIKHYMFSDEF